MSRHKCECVNCIDTNVIDIIKCVCNIEKVVDDVFRCLSCRPSAKMLQQVLTCLMLEDVRKIENLLTNESLSLEEIKNEMMQIENTLQTINNILITDLIAIAGDVRAINNSINSPSYGLERIETDIQSLSESINNPAFGLMRIETDIQGIANNIINPAFGLKRIETDIQTLIGDVESPAFGLKRIETDIQTLIGDVESPIFGLKEIEKRLLALEKLICHVYTSLTTGPVFINENARHLTVQVQNNTSEAHSVNIKVVRIDKQPFQEIFNKNLEIPPFSANEFRYITLEGSDNCDCCYGEIEVILNGIAAGLHPTIAQFNKDDKIITSSIFKSSDFVPKYS